MKTSQCKSGSIHPFASSRFILLSLFLFAVTLVVFWPVRNFEFLSFDDPNYFSANQFVLGGLTRANIGWAFTSNVAENWHPLTWMSLMLDVEIFGKGPAGPHLVNLLLHGANAVLLFGLLRYATATTWRSFIVAAAFALHPLHVESVAWIAERKDVLSTFFELLSLLVYVRWLNSCSPPEAGRPEGNAPPDRRRSPGLYGLCLLFFALALMSKPMAVTLPFLMLLLDYWPLQRFRDFRPGQASARLLWEKIPFFALSLAACVVTFLVQKSGGAVMSLLKISLVARIENAFVSYARYLGKTVWPAALANPYPHPIFWPVTVVVSAVLLFVAFSLCAIYVRRSYPFVIVGWLWFVGSLVPVIGLVQVGTQSMADRYTYLPLVGIFALVAWAGAAAFTSWRVPKAVMAVGSVLLLGACLVRTRQQIEYWQNDRTLFSHALAVTKNNYVASINLGYWFSRNGRSSDALACYRAATEMNPGDPSAFFDVANSFVKLGQLDEAIDNYRLALQVTDQYDFRCNLGYALAAKKDYAGAITNFEAAIQLKPNSAAAHNNLATILFIQNRFEEAAKQFQAALQTDPRNPQILMNLGDTWIRLNASTTAIQCYQQALILDPNNSRAKSQLQTLGAH